MATGMSPKTWLIVGLGNVGPEYVWTPHNLGFLTIDALAETAGIRVTRPEAKSHIGIGQFAGQDVILAKPQTMMNLSGIAVGMLLDRYEVDPTSMIVIADDVALPWGMLRIRERGSAGGHNGLKSVIAAAGTEFIRIRMGVQPERQWSDLRDYVLSQMSSQQEEVTGQMIDSAIEAVSIILTEGAGKAMTRFNRRVTPPEESAAN
jgi:peptidyl-tRNA hydrolase, PTH1 family